MALHVRLFDEFQRVCPSSGRLLEADSPALPGGVVPLTAGRGEFASFQVVFGPFTRRGGRATLRPSALKGPGKATIPAKQYDLFLEWYVRCEVGDTRRRKRGAKRKGRPAIVPDPLVPLKVWDGRVPLGAKGNDVPGQKYQAVWVDLFVPKDAKPGRYVGMIQAGAAGTEQEFAVELEVLRYRCPDELSFTLLMNNYADAVSAGWPQLTGDVNRHGTALYRRVERSYWRLAHDHRCVFYYLPYTHSGYIFPTFAPPLAGGGPKKRVKSWTVWDRHFGGYFDGSAFRGTRRGEIPVPRFFLPISLDWPASFLKWGRPGYADEFKAVMGQMAEHFKAKGWTRTCFDMFLNHKQRFKLYPWDCEETRFLEDNEVHRTFRTLWEGTLDHKTTAPVRFDYTLGCTWTIGIDLYSDLSEFIDAWLASSTGPVWYARRLAELQQRGVHYCSCGGGSSLASTRTAAFWPLQFWMWGADSFMVWTSMGEGRDPWHHVAGNGRLRLLYPGSFHGLDEALPSLRMKIIRNMLQTIERLEAAAKRSRGGRGAIKKKVTAAMGRTGLAAWAPPIPAYMAKKLPKDWTGADFATEEPPLAGWQDTSIPQYRDLAALAARLVK